MPGVEAPLVHAGIVLTVTGISRCVSLEAYGAVTPVPLVVGTGLAIAIDAPVVAEACGMGNIAAVEDVDVRIVGRGLRYSTPGLGDLLGKLVLKLYIDGDDVIRFNRFSLDGDIDPRMVTALASIGGTRAVIGGYAFPVGEIEGYWGVVVRLRRPAPMYRLLEGIYTDHTSIIDAVVAAIDSGIEGIRKLGEIIGKKGGRSIEKLINKAIVAGADAAILDISGRILLALAEDDVSASILSSRLRSLGERYEGMIIV